MYVLMVYDRQCWHGCLSTRCVLALCAMRANSRDRIFKSNDYTVNLSALLRQLLSEIFQSPQPSLSFLPLHITRRHLVLMVPRFAPQAIAPLPHAPISPRAVHRHRQRLRPTTRQNRPASLGRRLSRILRIRNPVNVPVHALAQAVEHKICLAATRHHSTLR